MKPIEIMRNRLMRNKSQSPKIIRTEVQYILRRRQSRWCFWLTLFSRAGLFFSGFFSAILLAFLVASNSAASPTGTLTDIANVPLASASSAAVLPNLLMIVDDSSSMSNDYLPDWAINNYCRNQVGSTFTAPCCQDSSGKGGSGDYACWVDSAPFSRGGHPPFMASDFNAAYYNPAINYQAPLNADGGSKPNQTSYTNVKDDYYLIQTSSSTDLTLNFPDSEWCTNISYTNCLRNGNYVLPGTVNGITYSIFHATTASGSGTLVTGSPGALSTTLRSWGPHYYTMLPGEYCDNINLRNCQASRTDVFTFPAPLRWCSSSENAAATDPASGSCQAIKNKNYTFPRYPTIFSSTSATFVRTDIVPGTTSYVYPGTTAKASTRNDCAASTCTYDEEMRNFANWWAYYRTRMQMMKTSTSIAFGPIDSRYRVGYFTINKYTDTAHTLNIAPFDATQKTSWYDKLFAADPDIGTTPLRAALSHAGHIYAGKLNSSPGAADPVQYSCQKNFTILSTDGYWNNRTGSKIDGVTAIGDQDGDTNSDTLADVAAYYYHTDLRTSALGNCTGAVIPPAKTGNDVCENNVPISERDAAASQHMTSFTLGLGIDGYMQYLPNYRTASSGDYFNVKNGSAANPDAGICSWQTSGVCRWPVPQNNAQSNIDDLWHAAINGHGNYYSTRNPASLSASLADALSAMASQSGASAAATNSNPNVVAEDNFLFSSTYVTADWVGDLRRQKIDLMTGEISSTIDWSAQAQLDANGARQIYTYDPGSANRLKRFTWDNLSISEKKYFNLEAMRGLSQMCQPNSGVNCVPANKQSDAANEKLVAYLAGDRSLEGSAAEPNQYYRQRTHLLGDIIGSEAVYVKKPLFRYLDAGYAAFKTTSRIGMVYVAANDGMLHALSADTGKELWGFIPSTVLPNLVKLADKNYANLHSYFLDGTPVSGDVYDGSAWRTILVGGMNAGGRGYYALDITDPDQPKALWEFTSDTSKGAGFTKDANLGYTFGKPEISKLKDGTWVVLVTSGYNNVGASASEHLGDGKGYLYVLNAVSGALIRSIPTGVGDLTSPSGLAQIRAWTDDGSQNNTVLRVYGGDLQGNVWRFDMNGDLSAAGFQAQLLATLRDASGNVQPITTKPELGAVDDVAMVYVGTGRYLGVSDLSDLGQQSLYAIKDSLNNTSYGNPRVAPSAAGFVKQTISSTTCPAGARETLCSAGQEVRTSSNLAVDLKRQSGWYVDLPQSGERANTDPQLAFGTLVFNTNIPASNACYVGGSSETYFFDYRSGAALPTSTNGVVGKKLRNALASRAVFARLPNAKVVSIASMADGTTSETTPPVASAVSSAKRISWRELLIDR